METPEAREELRVCQQERELLKQKLLVHLDRWALDKATLERSQSRVAREQGIKSAQLAYDGARNNLLCGSQQQQIFGLKLKLESERENVEILGTRIHALRTQLEEEQRMRSLAYEKLQRTKTNLRGKVSSRSKKVVQEAEKKVRQYETLLTDTQLIHTEAVGKIRRGHDADLVQLNDRILMLTSEVQLLKEKEQQWKIDMRERQAIVEERDKLIAKRDEWELQQKEMQETAEETKRLRVEKDMWKAKDQEMQELVKERDELISQKDHRLSNETEMQQLLNERDKLKQQLEEKAQHSDESVKEEHKLQGKLKAREMQREEEIKSLLREKDFVWSQMKKMEGDFAEKLEAMSEQILKSRQKIAKLKSDKQDLQAVNNEKMVELTIVRLDAKRAETELREIKELLAEQKRESPKTEVQELCSRLEMAEEENRRLLADRNTQSKSLTELTSYMKTLQKQLDDLKDQGREDGTSGGIAKEGPEVLNSEEGLTLDQEIFESQIEQATRVVNEDGKRVSKDTEELRRENENLRMLYGQLEVLYKETQKPEKVIRNVNRRDTTSRNLKTELEAAATSSPSDNDPLFEGILKKQKQGICFKQSVAIRTKSTQKRSKDESSKQNGHGKQIVEHVAGGSSVKKLSTAGKLGKRLPSSKPPRMSSSSKKREKLEQHACESTKMETRKRKVEDTNTEETEADNAEQSGYKSAVKGTRKRKLDDGDSEGTQRAHSQTIADSQSTHCKDSALRKSIRQENKKCRGAIEGSAKGSNKMMANLFSSAFSIPKLNVLTTPSSRN